MSGRAHRKSQERIIVEEIIDVMVPQVTEETVGVRIMTRVQNRSVVERVVDVPVPQISQTGGNR